MELPASPPTDRAAQTRGERWAVHWHRHKHLVAVLSFAAGVASFLMVERQQRVAQAMVVLLPLSWLLMLGEGWFQRLAWRFGPVKLSPLLLRYALQGVHQESFFFTLPFFLATTTWASGQTVFVGALSLAAVVSLIDPLYFGALATRRWAYLGFHALAVFVTVLTAAPMLWHLSTGQSLQLAILCMALLTVPSIAHVIGRPRWWHWPLLTLGAAAFGGAIWLARPFIPPATLWVAEALVSRAVSVESKTALPLASELTVENLRRDGVFVWTAIRAPRGLHERIEHVWLHEGVELDRVALGIVGGRDEGYRAWSHKRAFPADPRGDWQVRIVTQSGQLIGVVRFSVR